MSAEEFWKDDPQLFVSYRTSFINKKNREAEEEDYKSWLNGLYIHEGNGILFISLKQFIGNIILSFTKSGKKDMTKIDTYPKKPYMQLEKEKQKEQKQEEQKKNIDYNQYEDDLRYFGTMKKRYLEKLSKKGE